MMTFDKTLAVCKQRSRYDCILACIAMVAQKPYEDLWSPEILATCDEKKGVYGERVDEAFKVAGFERNVDYWLVPIPDFVVTSWFLKGLLKGRRAVLQVPSINNEGAQHALYWDGETITDPSNKQVYRWLAHCAPNNVWIFNERAG